MNSYLITTAVTTAIAAVGWIVNYIFSGYKDRQNQKLAASLKYTERQLEELYSPLYFLVLEGRCTFMALVENIAKLRGEEDILKSQSRSKKEYSIFPLSKKNEAEELKLWLFWVENDFLPRNNKIQELLMTKTHLIEGSAIPESYLDFLDHHTSWKINYLHWEKEQTSFSWESNISWSSYQFEKDVIQTFKKLKIQHTSFKDVIQTFKKLKIQHTSFLKGLSKK